MTSRSITKFSQQLRVKKQLMLGFSQRSNSNLKLSIRLKDCRFGRHYVIFSLRIKVHVLEIQFVDQIASSINFAALFQSGYAAF